MDIPALSTAMSQSNLQVDVSLALMKKAMENMEVQGEVVASVSTNRVNIMTSEHIDISI